MKATEGMYRAAAIVAAGPHNWEMCGESEREYYAKEVKPIVDAALAAAPPDDDAVTRVLEAAEKVITDARPVVLSYDVEVKGPLMKELQAAVSALRDREGR